MTTGLLSALHPTFETLSAHADKADLDLARTRVGRHIARCAACREVVSDIRELGDEARRMTLTAMPLGLWSRIEAAASTSAVRGSGPAATHSAMSAPRPRSMRRRVAGGIAGGLLAAGLVLALAWPRSTALQAAGTARLTFTPSRPVPGGTLRIRYDAPAHMKDAPRLVLVGRFAEPAGRNMRPLAARITRELADSVGTLTRGADGAFVGTVTLPADFLAMTLSVLDPTKDDVDADGVAPWAVIGGAANGAPSLASLLAAQDVTSTEIFYGDSPLRPRQAADAADSLKRYFPRHPAGWAYSRSYGVSRGRLDLLRFFESAERKYTSMFEALSDQPKLDAERLHDMVVFANRIDEPTEALRWAGRLADEHPEDPRALFDLAGALHSLELQSVPPDSVRRWLPALDRVYRAGPTPNFAFWDAQRLGIGYGDSTTRALWEGRASANREDRNIWMMAMGKRWSDDSAAAEIQFRAESRCTLTAGRYPLAQSAAAWRSRCELWRGVAYGYLAEQKLLDGHTRQALAEADSAIVSMRRGDFCTPSRGYLVHGKAALALGDTATAASDFVAGSAGFPASNRVMMDSARVLLGPRFDESAWRASTDSVRQAAAMCEADRRLRRQAQRRREQGLDGAAK